MGKKSKAKKQQKEKEVLRKWEDLQELRDEVISEVLTPHTYLYDMYEKNKNLIDKDKDLTKLVHGLDENFKDLIEEIKEVSSRHSNIGEDGKHVCRKGEIKLNDIDGILDYDDIHGKYILLSHKVVENGQKGLLNLVVTLAEKNNDFESAVIIDKAKKEIEAVANPLKLFNDSMESITNAINVVKGDKDGKQ